MAENVMLVNENDEMTGTIDKLAAHKTGQLHRALSVFIFNSKGELLLQQRAFDKYHSGGVWSNSCCSHPRLGEDTRDAADRRLNEEMGLIVALEEQFSFIYRVELENGLIEHEYDHVFFGASDHEPTINLDEVADFKYITMEALALELKQRPELYSAWLNICYEKVMEHYNTYLTSDITRDILAAL